MPSADPREPAQPGSARLGGRVVAMLLLGTLAFLVLALVAPWAWQQLGGSGSAPTAAQAAAPMLGLPWQIERRPDGTTMVFGLDLGRDDLGQAAARWPGETMKLAVIRDPARGTFALEGYLATIQAGFVQGRLVLTGEADAGRLAAWAARAERTEPQPSGALRLTLAPADEADARGTRIAAIAFLPAARFDEATAVERFGPPPERRATADGLVHLLYPPQGVVVTIDPQGRVKPVLQYVPPRDFERLRAPLAR